MFAGVSSAGIAAADIDDDGHLDIVASDEIFGVSVLFGDGDGTFARACVLFRPETRRPDWRSTTSTRMGGSTSSSPISTSRLGDGTVSVLLQKADGTFENVVSYTSGGLLPKAVQIADINSDGVLDLAIANTGSTADPNRPRLRS